MYTNIDKYWSAANYLSLAQIFLKDNVLLERDLDYEDIKRHPSGHWGTCPSVNFIIAHVNNYICRKKRNVQLIIGTGHSGNALSANLFLEGTLQNKYNLGQSDYEQLKGFVNIEKLVEGFRSEIGPLYPGTIYDGGELGYSLAVAMGAVLNNEDIVAISIIGDGECETGCLSASWNSIKCLGNKRGHVLPIINLNGFRMGDRSLLSRKSDYEIISMFGGMGYSVRMVNGNHDEMYEALEWADEIFSYKKDISNDVNPLIILKTPKGWTAPKDEIIQIEGKLRSHKNPLPALHQDEYSLNYLKKWLDSYHPNEIFETDGSLKAEIKANIPPRGKRLGEREYQRKPLKTPNIKKYMIDEGRSKSAGEVLETFFKDVIIGNFKSFRVISPDELTSNRLGQLIEYKENVLEILNENICQAWMQGYNLTGGNSIMISYEAFMPIIISMVSQYSKYLFQAEKSGWREYTPSMNYILTSTCWENTYSHQNPEFVNSLILQQNPYACIYYPIDTNTLLVSVNVSLHSERKINVITTAKKTMPRLLSIEAAEEAVEKGFYVWKQSSAVPDIVFVTIGDYCINEMQKVVFEFEKRYTKVSYTLISILELSQYISVASIEESDEFINLLKEGRTVIFLCHGYPSVINAIFGSRLNNVDYIAVGYKNKSISSVNTSEKMEINGCSARQILFEVNELLYRNKKISKDKYLTYFRKG